ncbi:MAG: SirB2 family protein [Gammaproteobacteria bacterium]
MMIFKIIHVTCAALSISGFLTRAWLKFYAPQHLHRRWIRISPHIIDTLLLASAIVLVYQTRQYPFVAPWVTTKLLMLFVYIGFGLLTLRFARTRKQTLAGLIGATLSFSFIIAVAVTHQAWPFC